MSDDKFEAQAKKDVERILKDAGFQQIGESAWSRVSPIDQKKRSAELGDRLMSRMGDPVLDEPVPSPMGCFYPTMLGIIFGLLVIGFVILAVVKA